MRSQQRIRLSDTLPELGVSFVKCSPGPTGFVRDGPYQAIHMLSHTAQSPQYKCALHMFLFAHVCMYPDTRIESIHQSSLGQIGELAQHAWEVFGTYLGYA